MRRMNRVSMSPRAGVALVYVTLAVLIASGMVATMLTLSTSTERVSTSNRHELQAQYLADGAIEEAKKLLQTQIANFLASGIYIDVDSGEYVPVEYELGVEGFPVQTFIERTPYESESVQPSGIVTINEGYEITATAEVNGFRSTAHRVITAKSTPIFQFAVFYTGDLEINPGPSMRLGGRVHSNGNIHLGCGNTLTVDTNYLRAVGDIYRNRKDNPGASTGSVLVRKWVENPYDPSEPDEYFKMLSKGQMTNQGVATKSGWDSNFTEGLDSDGDGYYDGLLDWMPFAPGAIAYTGPPDFYAGGSTGQTMMTSSHGLSEAVTPDIGSKNLYEELVDQDGNKTLGGDYEVDEATGEMVAVAAGTGSHKMGYYAANAGLRIIGDQDTGTFKVLDASGKEVSDSWISSVITVKDFYDARQAPGASPSKVKVLEVDIAKLNAATWDDSGAPAFPPNGLIYASWDELAVDTDAWGVKLVEGSKIGPAAGAALSNGLTVVSESQIYVQGDYNTTDKVGAAVIGDAVSLLSNSWDDSKTQGVLPGATETTFNMAMITGNQETNVGDYNGGLENLPRFHEKWSSVKCNINGSLVNAWQSQVATGEWSYGGDIYRAPIRTWAYDTDFNDSKKLPPYTPMAVTTENVVSW